jgi:hypothetical protein
MKGDLTCRTVPGKLISMFLALFGVPLISVVFLAISSVAHRVFGAATQWLNERRPWGFLRRLNPLNFLRWLNETLPWESLRRLNPFNCLRRARGGVRARQDTELQPQKRTTRPGSGAGAQRGPQRTGKKDKGVFWL